MTHSSFGHMLEAVANEPRWRSFHPTGEGYVMEVRGEFTIPHPLFRLRDGRWWTPGGLNIDELYEYRRAADMELR